MSKIPAPDELIGGRYRIVKLIGEGGMGAVYEAENVVTHKRVALKWMHPGIADKPEFAQRLVREAQAASRIRHPNVVDVYDVVTSDGTIFLILELLEGEPLYEVLDRGGMLVPQFIALLLQAMRGVAAAHHHGIIHRDVHPGNIFLERVGNRGEIVAKVLDFGISKITGETSSALTQSGTTIGTPLYMSYEQLCANRDLDARADIYSFGVILYRALTGRYPFQAESLTELAVQFATSKPASVKVLRPEIPTALDRLVMACVARERELRPATVEQLMEELEPFSSEEGFRALLSGRARQIPVVVGRPTTRLHADGASFVPPTNASYIPATPSGNRPSSAAWPGTQGGAPAEANGPNWIMSAVIGSVVALLTGAVVLLWLERQQVAEAHVPPPPVPAPQLAAPTNGTSAANIEPGLTTSSRDGKPEPAIPNGARTPDESNPVQPVKPGSVAKPARVWVPKPAAGKPSTDSAGSSPDDEGFRVNRPPVKEDF